MGVDLVLMEKMNQRVRGNLIFIFINLVSIFTLIRFLIAHVQHKEIWFIDYQNALNRSVLKTPWGLANQYPPANFEIFKIFHYLGNLTSPDIALGLYIFAVLIAFGIPIWHLRYKRNFIGDKTFWGLLTLSLFSATALFTIQTGNPAAFLVPIAYFFYLGIVERKVTLSCLCIVAIVNIKPQFGILLMVILIWFGVKPFIKWSLISFSTFSLGFIFYSKNLFHNIKEFIHWLLSYQGAGALSNVDSTNLSLTNLVGFGLKTIGWEIPAPILIKINQLIFGSLILFILIFHKKIPQWHLTFILFIIPIIALPIIWRYYLIWMSPIFFIYIYGMVDNKIVATKMYEVVKQYFFGSRWLKILSGTVILTAFISIYPPQELLVHIPVVGEKINYNIFWYFGAVAFNMLFVYWVVDSIKIVIKRSRISISNDLNL